MLNNVPRTETRIVVMPLGIIKPIGINPKNVKIIIDWYAIFIILITLLLKRDKINGNKNNPTMIISEILNTPGSSKEMVLSPTEFFEATNNIVIAEHIIKNTNVTLFNMITPPYHKHTILTLKNVIIIL